MGVWGVRGLQTSPLQAIPCVQPPPMSGTRAHAVETRHTTADVEGPPLTSPRNPWRILAMTSGISTNGSAIPATSASPSPLASRPSPSPGLAPTSAVDHGASECSPSPLTSWALSSTVLSHASASRTPVFSISSEMPSVCVRARVQCNNHPQASVDQIKVFVSPLHHALKCRQYALTQTHSRLISPICPALVLPASNPHSPPSSLPRRPLPLPHNTGKHVIRSFHRRHQQEHSTGAWSICFRLSLRNPRTAWRVQLRLPSQRAPIRASDHYRPRMRAFNCV